MERRAKVQLGSQSKSLRHYILILVPDLEWSKRIVKMLDYHPLAIDSAAAYLQRRPFISTERYVSIFKNKMKETRPQELLNSNDRLWPDYPLTCMTTFEISEEAIRSDSPNSSKLLQLCAWFDKDSIWVPYLREQAKALGSDVSGWSTTLVDNFRDLHIIR
jgi:hypothetical protein